MIQFSSWASSPHSCRREERTILIKGQKRRVSDVQKSQSQTSRERNSSGWAHDDIPCWEHKASRRISAASPSGCLWWSSFGVCRGRVDPEQRRKPGHQKGLGIQPDLSLINCWGHRRRVSVRTECEDGGCTCSWMSAAPHTFLDSERRATMVSGRGWNHTHTHNDQPLTTEIRKHLHSHLPVQSGNDVQIGWWLCSQMQSTPWGWTGLPQNQ